MLISPPTFTANSKGLWTEGFLVVPKMLARPSADRLCSYTSRVAAAGLASDSQVPETPAKYGDPVLDRLLEAILPTVESLSNRHLNPTYSYFRVYKHNDTLARHTDRAACQISVSIALGCRPDVPWPLWVQGLRATVPVDLQPGDAVLYLGTQCPHWREAFHGDTAAQAFLHYVDQEGPFCDWKFDKRSALAHHGAAQSPVNAPPSG